MIKKYLSATYLYTVTCIGLISGLEITMNWKIFRDLKIEIILWTFFILSTFNILYFLPTSTFSQMRDIFMGMNVELPQMTKIVMSFSAFIIHWKIIYLPVLVVVLFLYIGQELK